MGAAKSLIRTIDYDVTRVKSVQDVIASAIVGKNEYTYDSLGRIVTDAYTSSRSNSDNKKYTYDQYGQLICEDNGGP